MIDLSTTQKKIYIVIAGVALGLGIGIIYLWGVRVYQNNDEYLSAYKNTSLNVGASAPDFNAFDLNGNVLGLADFRGKFILLNFWATWCAPCRLEMPVFQSKQQLLASKLSIVGINFDEPANLVKDYVDSLGLTFDILLDPGGIIQESFQIRGYPTSIFVNPEGQIEIIHIGIMTESQFDGYLDDLGLVE